MKMSYKNTTYKSSFENQFTLEELFQEFYKKLVYFSFQLVKDQENAEDIVQEVFIKFWDNRQDVPASKPAIQNYLYKAVKNASMNLIRHYKVRDKYIDQVENNSVEDSTVIDAMIYAEVLAELHAAIETLPEACQQISRLGYLEGKSNKEIAQQLDISVNTVKTQKQRGLQLLRMRIRPEMLYLIALCFPI
ncbi:RNA polymerase sigma-70 factor [Rapidithrix thailandica]|uniref:RNA polymerase sigma-70 factor n=1 Tax=Rapidithrix thailandica TaxID=413964 RepID=A0AAW9SEW2_9BACT